MADESFGPWAPLTLGEVRELLATCPAPWWITGGHALELHLGRTWRAHDDIDVGIRRCDAEEVLGHLIARGWEPVVAAAGTLSPWDGGPLSAAEHLNNVWCRRPGGDWQLDVTVGDGDDAAWVYRRDPSLRRPWTRAVLDRDGIRYLAPELQLLFKSTDVRPKDTVDAVQVVPALDPGRIAFLDARLRGEHPWRAVLDAHRRPFDEHDVVEVLGVFDEARVDAWLDGGWAVDALVGRPTRHHGDLDLAIARRQWVRARAVLADRGFELVRDDGPHNIVVVDHLGRLVDLHAFDDSVGVIGDDGIERCGGEGLAYELHGFDGAGTVGGRQVRCISPDTLVRYHTGYHVDADDWHDVCLLHDHFGIPVPADYEVFRPG